ncbi:MAG: hypothetical protein M3T96_01665 [Acidobacteriota bacterium]|nr:hypothetical protein [Acidobacteriota bacterium]
MKALSLVGVFFAALLIFLGFSTRATAGVLGDAVVFIGVVIAIFVAVIWIITIFKEKKNRENDLDDFDS